MNKNKTKTKTKKRKNKKKNRRRRMMKRKITQAKKQLLSHSHHKPLLCLLYKMTSRSSLFFLSHHSSFIHSFIHSSIGPQYKIQRKIREHNRKMRKIERAQGTSKLKKDPGIPNLHPFKDRLLAQVKPERCELVDC